MSVRQIILLLAVGILLIIKSSFAQFEDPGTGDEGLVTGDEEIIIDLFSGGENGNFTGDGQNETEVDSGEDVSSGLVFTITDIGGGSGDIDSGIPLLGTGQAIDSGTIDESIFHLILSEVYYDGTDEWIEITNIGDGNFQGNFTLSGAKSALVSLTNISIFSGQSKIFGDNLVQISGASFIGKTGLSLSMTDTETINLHLLISGQIVDSLFVDSYRANKYNDKKTSFEKLGEVATRVQTDRRANMQSGYTINPGMYFTAGNNITDVSVPPIIQSGTTLQLPISCDDLDPRDLIKINEIFPGDEKYPAYIELAIHDNITLDSLSISGSHLTSGVEFSLASGGTTLEKNTLLLISASGFRNSEGIVSLQNNDFSLGTTGGFLLITIGSGQNRRVMDIVYLSGVIAGKSSYFGSTSYQCARIMDAVDDFSPGFERRFLKYFPVTTVNKIEYVEVFTGNQSTTGSCSNSLQTTLFSGNTEGDTDISSRLDEYTVSILDIDYDPEGSDTNNEKITLRASNNSGDVTPLNMSKTFRLKVNGRNKRLSGMLEMNVPTTFTKTFGFPNSTDSGQDVIISLTYGDHIFDTYTYNPNKLSSQDEEALTTTGYYVSSVIDGDTFRIKYQGKTQSIRLLGIDAPESNKTRYKYLECFGTQAKDYLKSLIDKKKITFQFDPTQDQKDIYDRLVAYVFLEDENINQTMIEDGYAKEYTYKTAYGLQSQFKQAEQSAQNQQLGLWNESTCGVSFSGVVLTGDVENTGTSLDLSGLQFTITYVLPNPKGSDKAEELGLLLSNELLVTSHAVLVTELDLSQGFTLRVGNSKKKIEGIVHIGQENILSGSLGLVNKAACVSLFYEEQELTKFCYGKPKEGQKIYSSASGLAETTQENLDILTLLQLKRIDNDLCVRYKDQSVVCKRIPASKAEIKTVNEKNLYKGFASLMKQYLLTNWKDLYYDTPFKEYFDRLSQNNKLIAQGILHIDMYGQKVLTSNIKNQFTVLQNTLASVVAVFEGANALFKTE